MMWLMGALAFLGGVLNTAQSGSNASLAKALLQPVLAALVVAVVSAAAYLVAGAVLGLGLPDQQALRDVPWWAWCGGAFGSVYVLVSIFFAEQLGAGLFIALTVTAGVMTSITMDHFGLFGFKQHSADVGRLLGAALMIGGVILVGIS